MSELSHLHTNNSVIRGFLQTTPRIYNVCKALFDNYDINHFAYVKFLKDEYMLRLSSNEEWSKNYYENFFHKNLDFYRNQIENKKNVPDKHLNYCLWNQDSYNKDSSVYLELKKYNMGNGFSIYINRDNTIESFHFASPTNAFHMSNFYINNLKLLENFILNFKFEIQDLENSFSDDALLKLPYSDLYEPPDLEDESLEDDFSPKKYLFDSGENIMYLGKREFQCLFLLSMGKHCKEIAKILNISPRTVETHINTLKSKTGSPTTSRLIETFIEKNLSKWYFHLRNH